MKTNRKLTKLALVAISALLLSPIPHASAADTINVCVNKSSGAMRQLLKGKCRSTEKKMVLSKVGPVGPTGPAGNSGNTILSGIVDPTDAVGKVGDFYINTASSKLFGPKTTSWPAGTSLVGPSGAGGSGPQGPAGLTGASTSILWLNARDLLASREGVGGDTSSVSSLALNNSGSSVEVLDLIEGKARVAYRPIPKGWSNASSITLKVYWTTTTTQAGKTVRFALNGSTRSDEDDLTLEPWSVATEGTNKAALGGKILQVTTFEWVEQTNYTFATLAEGDIFGVTLYRTPASSDATVFTGNVYVIGISIEANFP